MTPRILAFVLLSALAACAPAPGTERLSAGATVDIASAGTQLSARRATQGMIRPLIHSPALQAAAQAQADDLHRSGRLGHIGADGSTLTDRLQRAGYSACTSAENVANGTPDIRSTVALWMDSPDHRANILNPQVTQFGFAGTGETWVLVLARPC
ncbi:CAP domain-containing protein [Roseicyclus persicicus]|uniref:CAP domain-containing protein n=1 Tax=Roseicyclus persicicus TaxID=2650661 RepID=A0A7X6JYR7_9RHOB|nr:CAP domain-containing protein [Roseibacterium persicicum]NKX44395.1 CAP domain-containing protein [Roseibacterium persicicum]